MLKIENLHYTYEDGTPALNGIDLEIARGEFLAILGSNGSGKTTLIRHLNGLYRPSLGRVLLDGQPLGNLADREVFSRIGIVFQDPNDQLFAATVEEDVAFGPANLGLGPEEVKERVHRALHQVHMQDYARKSIHALSHGQKKRVCVAGVMAMRPQVMILDEPTAGLDPQGEELLLEILRGLDTTLLLVSHDMFFVGQLTRRTLVMHQGRILRDLPSAEFLVNEGLAALNGLAFTYRQRSSSAIRELQHAHEHSHRHRHQHDHLHRHGELVHSHPHEHEHEHSHRFVHRHGDGVPHSHDHQPPAQPQLHQHDHPDHADTPHDHEH